MNNEEKGTPVEVHRRRFEHGIIYDEWLPGIIVDSKINAVMIEGWQGCFETKWFPRNQPHIWRIK